MAARIVVRTAPTKTPRNYNRSPNLLLGGLCHRRVAICGTRGWQSEGVVVRNLLSGQSFNVCSFLPTPQLRERTTKGAILVQHVWRVLGPLCCQSLPANLFWEALIWCATSLQCKSRRCTEQFSGIAIDFLYL